MTGLFLSYAWADDGAFVEQVHGALVAAGFEVWWDRKRMPSRGRPLLQEVREAIDAADRVIVVVGAEAVRSEYVRSEWQYALCAQKVVVPVLRLGDQTLVPPELGGLFCPDLRRTRPWDEGLAELVRVLREATPPLGPLWRVPPTPPHFLPRPDDLSSVAQRVLSDNLRPEVVSDSDRITVLCGMAGVGKSVLAAAFARSTSVRRAFSDGVAWLRLGQEPELLGAIGSLVKALGHRFAGDGNLADWTDELAAVLEHRAVLIVLDDAWRLCDVEPFVSALGRLCRVLVTARAVALAEAFAARRYELGVLGEPAALDLLADWTAQPAQVAADDQKGIARECGYLPFALALCGRMMRSGVEAADLWRALARADLSFVEARLPDYPHKTLLKSLSVGVDFLRHDEPVAADRFGELVALPAGAPFPASVAVLLWGHTAGMQPAEARKVLAMLAERGLLHTRLEEEQRVVWMHDLQHDYLRATCPDLPSAHGQLVASYRALCGGRWPSLTDDGYVFDHLVRHMAEAGDTAELYRVFDRQWLGAQYRRSGSHQAFARDLELGMQTARGERPANLIQLGRAAVLRSTLRSIASNVPATVLRALVHAGRGAVALGYASLIDKREEQCGAFISIAQVRLQVEGPDAELLSRATRSWRLVADGPWRLGLLSSLAKVLADGAPDQLLELSRTLGREPYPLSLLVPALARAGADWRSALASIPEPGWRAHALKGVARELALRGAIDGALEALSSVPAGYEDGGAHAVVAGEMARSGDIEGARRLIERLPAELPSMCPDRQVEALGRIAVALADKGERELAAEMAMEAAALSGGVQSSLAADVALLALGAAHTETEQWERLDETIELARRRRTSSTADEILQRAVGKAASRGEFDRADHLRERILSAGLRQAASMIEAVERARAGDVPAALATAREIARWAEEELPRQQGLAVLGTLAETLIEAGLDAEAARLIRHCLQASELVTHGWQRVTAFISASEALADYGLGDSLLSDALRRAQQIEEPETRGYALCRLSAALYVRGDHRESDRAASSAFDAARSVRDRDRHCQLLENMAVRFAKSGQLALALRAARSAMPDEYGFCFEEGSMLGAVASVLSELGDVSGLDAALEAAGRLDDPSAADRIRAAKITVLVRNHRVQAAEQLLDEIKTRDQRDAGLAALAAGVAGGQGGAAAAAELIGRIENQEMRACAECAVAEVLSNRGLQTEARRAARRAVELVEAMEDPGGRGRYTVGQLLGVLAKLGDAADLDRAVDFVLDIDDDLMRVHTLYYAARSLAEAGALDHARRVALDALSTAEAAVGRPLSDHMLRSACGALAHAGEIALSLGTAEKIASDGIRANTVAEAARAVAAPDAGALRDTVSALLLSASRVNLNTVYSILDSAAPSLAELDRGKTLLQMCRTSIELDDWWSSSHPD